MPYIPYDDDNWRITWNGIELGARHRSELPDHSQLGPDLDLAAAVCGVCAKGGTRLLRLCLGYRVEAVEASSPGCRGV
jgi:hypothetical protein